MNPSTSKSKIDYEIPINGKIPFEERVQFMQLKNELSKKRVPFKEWFIEKISEMED